MKPNPILDELWKVKDQLAAEAGYDVDRFLENLRRWEAEHPFRAVRFTAPRNCANWWRKRRANEPRLPP